VAQFHQFRPQRQPVLPVLLAFVSSWIADGRYVFIALLWLVPDRRIERMLVKREEK
jgi:hypothetical protein